MELATLPPTRVSSTDLFQGLEGILGDYLGSKQTIRSIRRRRSKYSSSYTIENLEVALDGNESLRLVFKDLSFSSLLDGARKVRPAFLYRPAREIEMYRRVLNSRQLNTPICYGAIEQPETDRYWLFLERVNGVLLWQVGNFKRWVSAARWLGGFHNLFRCVKQHKVLPGGLLNHNSEYYMHWAERASEFLERRNCHAALGLKTSFQLLIKNYGSVVARLLSLPRTLIHGEFYPSNIILRRKFNERHICPIDWEAAALGPGLIDLAALASGAWSEAQKEMLIRAYYDSLEPEPGWRPKSETLIESVAYCQLHLAVQWLGWSSDWTPPKVHEQNWLNEAVTIAKRLGII